MTAFADDEDCHKSWADLLPRVRGGLRSCRPSSVASPLTERDVWYAAALRPSAHDQVFLDGVLAEDTFDWFVQDAEGNVWYFGEDSKEIEDGQIVSTEGSWEAGVGDDEPGNIMLAGTSGTSWSRSATSECRRPVQPFA